MLLCDVFQTLTQTIERIPTISTQLKIVATVKATMIGADGNLVLCFQGFFGKLSLGTSPLILNSGIEKLKAFLKCLIVFKDRWQSALHVVICPFCLRSQSGYGSYRNSRGMCRELDGSCQTGGA